MRRCAERHGVGQRADALDAKFRIARTGREGDLAHGSRLQCRCRAEIEIACHHDHLGALLEHFDGSIGALRRVGFGVGGDDGELPAEHAALGVDVGDGELGALQGAVVIGLDKATECDGGADNNRIFVSTGLPGEAGEAQGECPGHGE